jgi:hypothetical protein
VGAYTLAGELAAAHGNHTQAYPAYERALADYVRRSRSFARQMVTQLIPRNRLHAWAMTTGIKLVTTLPTPLLRAATSRTRRLGCTTPSRSATTTTDTETPEPTDAHCWVLLAAGAAVGSRQCRAGYRGL